MDVNDNELLALETVHLFVELLESYFSNVCELDIVFNFNKVGLTRCTRYLVLFLGSNLKVEMALYLVSLSLGRTSEKLKGTGSRGGTSGR